MVEQSSIGEKLDFSVSRDGKLIALKVTVFERPDDLDETLETKPEEDKTESTTPDMQSFFDFFSDFFGRR